MDPLTILAVIDAGITGYERVLKLMDEARKAGVITLEEQQERMAKVNDIRAEIGLPPQG